MLQVYLMFHCLGPFSSALSSCLSRKFPVYCFAGATEVCVCCNSCSPVSRYCRTGLCRSAALVFWCLIAFISVVSCCRIIVRQLLLLLSLLHYCVASCLLFCFTMKQVSILILCCRHKPM